MKPAKLLMGAGLAVAIAFGSYQALVGRYHSSSDVGEADVVTLSKAANLRKASGGDLNQFVDKEYGVKMTAPFDWVVSEPGRWGEQETSVHFTVFNRPRILPSMYYKIRPATSKPSVDELQAIMLNQAKEKERFRIKNGLLDYHNRSDVKFRYLDNKGYLSWTADYTWKGARWSEYLVRIASSQCALLYFVEAPTSEIAGVAALLDEMAEQTVVP